MLVSTAGIIFMVVAGGLMIAPCAYCLIKVLRPVAKGKQQPTE
jgi:hypothetical protein